MAKCSHCGGGVYRGEHYPQCPRGTHAKPRPSTGGYGIFKHSSGDGYVVRTMDDLRHPYRPEQALRVFKRRADADKYEVKMNSGSRRRGPRRQRLKRNTRGRFTRAGRTKRYGSAATRDYEYIVYKSTVADGSGVKIPGLAKKGYAAAKAYAKSRPYWGSGIYSVSNGAFVARVNQKGKIISIARWHPGSSNR